MSARPPLAESPAAAPAGSSYGQILRSSSIIGGAQGINYLIGMVRTKLVAVLLGPSGVGLVGLYLSVTGLVGTFAGLGIGQSGVREVAEAHGSGNPEKVAATVKTLRRACWFTGALGWLLTAALSYPLSIWAFGSGERALPIALLGATLLLGAVSGGQKALLQGVRRIGDLARLNVLSVVAGTVVAVGLYSWFGQNGIVPVLITVAAFNLLASWWFARRVTVAQVHLSPAETWSNAKRLVGLGLAFMWSGLLTAGVALVIRGLIVRDLGLDANGIYQAAWGISGMFAGFILGAMGADFYPRLTALANDRPAMVRLVNEQTEIGILLALPGLLGTLAFAPWLMRIFYTAAFLPGAELLPWFVLGILGRVLSWPLGFIQLALGAGRWFAATETIFVVCHLVLSVVLLRWLGLWGVALAFALLYALYLLGMLLVGFLLVRFTWSQQVRQLLLATCAFVAAGFLAQRFLPTGPGLAAGAVLTTAAGLLSLRGIATRLGGEHRLVRLACRFPGGKWLGDL